jgi:hypothetical protein
MVGYLNVGARRGEANGTMALLLAVMREVAEEGVHTPRV